MNTSRRGFFGMVAGVLAACGVKAATPNPGASVGLIGNSAAVTPLNADMARYVSRLTSEGFYSSYERYRSEFAPSLKVGDTIIVRRPQRFVHTGE